ncbi:MAG: DUF2975 domain-containing protein [Halanaerobiales bacterium]
MEIKENITERLNTYSKLFGLVWYIMLAISIVVVVSVILILTGVIDSSAFNFSLQGFGFSANITGLASEDGFLFNILLAVILIFALLIYNIKQVREILRNTIERGTPFIKENVLRMKSIAYSIFVYAVVSLVLEVYFISTVDESVFSKISNLEQIEISSRLSIPLWPIVVGVLILILSEIFQYGYELQQDSDAIL